MESEKLSKMYKNSDHVSGYLKFNYSKENIEANKKPTFRATFDTLYRSEQQSLNFLKGKFNSVIDAGCGTGAISKVLVDFCMNSSNYNYLGVDIDHQMIDSANRYFKSNNASFIVGDVLSPSKSIDFGKRDLLLGFNLITQYSDWKNALKGLRKLNTRFINLSTSLTFNSPTIVDDDLSYVFYGGTTKVVTAIHNIFWIYAFLCSPGMDASEINVFCYKKNTINMIHPVDLNDLYVGNIVAEFDPAKSWVKTGRRPLLRIYDNEFLRYSSSYPNT